MSWPINWPILASTNWTEGERAQIMRQLVLDTETTGLVIDQGNRIIEIGAVELINRRLTGNHYHAYINPEHPVEEGALEVHGISDDFLADKPLFSQVADEFIDFIRDAELLIHNAPFDVAFLDNEFGLLGGRYGRVTDYCQVVDTLAMAREKHPGQRNTLDALCKRYTVDNSQRELHGALLDAEILADVYLMMTGGQTALSLGAEDDSQDSGAGSDADVRVRREGLVLPVVQASAAEQERHQAFLARMSEDNGDASLWQRLGDE